MSGFFKTIALVLIMSLVVPPPQAQARRNGKVAALIGAAILGAAISSSSRRSRSYENARVYAPGGSSRRYSTHGGAYYGGRGYTGATYGGGGYVYPTRNVYQPPANLYRTNSGYGYDRYGSYRYDTGRYSRYRSSYRRGGGCY